MQRILVTGGAGYVGSVLCEHLLDAGHGVTVIDNISLGQRSLFHLCHDTRFRFVHGDARDERIVAEEMKRADVVIPLAALVGAPVCERDPALAESLNLGAVQMVNRLRSREQLVIYPNTNSGYGASTGETLCTEETPLEPISVYGRTKCDAENELLGSESAVTFRLATVFGFSPRMRLDLLVNHFTYAAVTDGYLVLFEKDFKRNYVHVRDVADCFVYAIENSGAMVGRPYNLGYDEANLSKEELALKIKEYVPRLHITCAEIGEDPDKRNYIVSSKRLADAGFTAKRSLDQGIVELLKGYRMLPRGHYGNK